MPNRDNVQIAPAEGEPGVLVPGMDAVTTTFIAGLKAIQRGLARPIGSLTELGTGRLGTRIGRRSSGIRDFLRLAIFGWLGYPMQIKVNFRGRDAILAAPPMLDIVLFMDRAQRAGMRGEDLITHLGLEYYD